jgi:hypothetical protein
MISERSEESEKICLSGASLFFRNEMERSRPAWKKQRKFLWVLSFLKKVPFPLPGRAFTPAREGIYLESKRNERFESLLFFNLFYHLII